MRCFSYVWMFILVVLIGCNDGYYSDPDAFNEDVAEASSGCRVSETHGFHAGDGSAGNPFQICRIEHLTNLRSKLSSDEYDEYYNKSYILTADIDLEGSESNNFFPIGDVSDISFGDLTTPPNNRPFEGIFYGNFKTISGFYFKGYGFSYIGFFQYLGEDAIVRDLTLNYYFDLDGPNYFVGGVAAYSAGRIENVTVNGVITGVDLNVAGLITGYQKLGHIKDSKLLGQVISTVGVEIGGVVGSAEDTLIEDNTMIPNGIINELPVFPKVEGFASIGGIAGKITQSTIKNMDSTYRVISTGDYVGGVAGQSLAQSTIEDVDNIEIVNSLQGQYVGGIVGYASETTLKNIHNTGTATKKVRGKSFVGGVAGYVTSSTIENFSTNKNVDCSDDSCGGLIGYLKGSTLKTGTQNGVMAATQDSIGGAIGFAWDSTLDSISTTGSVYGGKNIGGMIGQVQGDIDILGINSRSGDVIATDSFVGGMIGIVDGTITIDPAATITINPVVKNVVGTYSVGGLIGKITTTIGEMTTLDWITVKANVSGVSKIGGFIGEAFNNFAIRNSASIVSVDALSGDAGGIVGRVVSAEAAPSSSISNTIVNPIGAGITCDLANDSGVGHCGGVVGYAYSNLNITSVQVNIPIFSNVAFVGGIIGYGKDITIFNSTFNSTVDSNGMQATGGLGGLLVDSAIIESRVLENTVLSPEVSGGVFTGGLVGKAEAVSITKSFSTAEVYSTGNIIGGLAGELSSNCTIQDSYALADISAAGTSARIGGIAGKTYNSNLQNVWWSGVMVGGTLPKGGINASEAGTGSVVTGAYWNTDSGVLTSVNGTGATTVEMQSSGQFVGYDFLNVWNTPSGTYPSLQ